jgi:N-acetylmuramoyl-L-alanine amidase
MTEAEMTEDALDVLVRTVYGEARGEPKAGQVAVVHVIRNRVDRPGWWGHDIASVCLAPWQFSCWNVSDPNRALIEALPRESEVYQQLAQLVRLAWDEADTTDGADHYFAPKGMPGGKPPSWAMQYRRTVSIGRHVFYSSVPAPAAPLEPPTTMRDAAKTDTGRAAIGVGAVGALIAAAGPLVTELAKMPPLTMAALGATLVALAIVAALAWRRRRP